MEDYELGARVKIVVRLLAACGVTDEERVMAIVDLTMEIPWLIPAFRGNTDAGDMLFASACKMAALSTTHGVVKPGDIFDAAINLAGTATSVYGHTSERAWVKKARYGGDCFGLPPGVYKQIEQGIEAEAVEKASEAVFVGPNAYSEAVVFTGLSQKEE